MIENVNSVSESEGAFLASLRRNNKQIKEARALSIYEDAQMFYSRKIDDMERELKKLERSLEDMLDMSPENTTTLKLAVDFNAENFVNEDDQIIDRIRNLTIAIDLRKRRYNVLFGTHYLIANI